MARRALCASGRARDGLAALAAFDVEIRHALRRARDPNLAAMRLAWWREAIAGERPEEAAGDPVTLALRAAIAAFALPPRLLEAMIDARLQEIAPQDDFNLARIRAFAGESEGARLRLAARIAAGGQDLDPAQAHAPAGMALALSRMLHELPSKAGSAPTLFPADVAARYGASLARLRRPPCDAGRHRGLRRASRARRARSSPRRSGGCKAQPGDPAGLRSPRRRCGSNSTGSTAMPPDPFDAAGEVSPLRRQWAIWRWARAR